MPKRNKINPYLESKVIVKHGGKIDLKKLWASEVEADPEVIKRIQNGDEPRQA